MGAVCSVARVALVAPAAAAAAAAAEVSTSLAEWLGRVDNSWVRDLESESGFPPSDLRMPRQVLDGHWVRAVPTALEDEYVVACSHEVMGLVGLWNGSCANEDVARFFSGGGPRVESWSTPYSLSIYGQEVVPERAGPRGDGYGDGRAISVAEIVVGGHRWEVQLKGAGRTAFARTGDGRAVLRSSIREFLASEALAAMGVPTTRIAMLTASRRRCRVDRPWYSANKSSAYKHGGDVIQTEPCAVAARVAPSFIRVGHFELYARRRDRRQLGLLWEHAFRRRDGYQAGGLADFARQAAQRQARLAAEWLRVGYVQSNFNSDNCLVSGLTVDFGPMGFVERYDPSFVMWIGGGDHFAFMNQPEAARRNFHQFREALKVLCDDEPCRVELDDVDFPVEAEVDRVWAAKLGFAAADDTTRRLADRLLHDLMVHDGVDFTILFRQLGDVAERNDSALAAEFLRPAFYEAHSMMRFWRWAAWLDDWLCRAPDPVLMRRTNPKYVPREWMLAEAYGAAQAGDLGPVRRLHELFRRPYDDDLPPDVDAAYYRKAPPETQLQGGIAFMS